MSCYYPLRTRARPARSTRVLCVGHGRLVVIDAGDAGGTHARDDLVVDRAHRVGPVIGGRLAAVTGAEQGRDVPGADVVVAAVQHDLIHAHPAGDGAYAAREVH